MLASRSAECKSKVIRIKRDWVNAVRSCKGECVDWSAVLKVWLYLIDNKADIIKSSEIAEVLGISKSVVSRARGILIELNAIKVDRINQKVPNGKIYCLGSRVEVYAWIDD